MSVFSILKRGRQAKEQASNKQTEIQSEKQAGKQKEELPSPKYHHVPTHAAVDALLGAPAGWMRDDAQRIRENNRKRTAMDAVQPGRLPRSGNSAMLSPLHIDVHAGRNSQYVYGDGNGSSSSSNINLPPRWSRSPSSRSISRCLSSPGVTPLNFASPDYSSLDAEIYRARIHKLEADDACRTTRSAPVAAISPSPSLTLSSPTSSPSSSPSTSPTTCSTPSFGSSQSFKNGNNDYFGDICEEYNPAHAESYEMTLLASGTRLGGSFNSNNSISIISSQHDLPSTGFQKRRKQHNPYSHPVRIEEQPHLHQQVQPRNDFPRSISERTLVPRTIRSSKQSPASTTFSFSPTPEPCDPGNKTRIRTGGTKAEETHYCATTSVGSRVEMSDTAISHTRAQWPLPTEIQQPEAVAF